MLNSGSFSSYDDEIDKVNQYQRLSLEALEKIEIGKNLSTYFLNAFNNSSPSYSKHPSDKLKQQTSSLPPV